MVMKIHSYTQLCDETIDSYTQLCEQSWNHWLIHAAVWAVMKPLTHTLSCVKSWNIDSYTQLCEQSWNHWPIHSAVWAVMKQSTHTLSCVSSHENIDSYMQLCEKSWNHTDQCVLMYNYMVHISVRPIRFHVYFLYDEVHHFTLSSHSY